MNYSRVLTIQDISCVGQCSLTVAMPILSACGLETCILPSAVLSNHTAPGYHGFTFRDLTEDIPTIMNQWKVEGILFDAIYSGYLGSIRQIELVEQLFQSYGKKKCVKVVDPAMADNGVLYKGFDMPYVKKMAELCAKADIVLPNITEACLIANMQYKEKYDEVYIKSLLNAVCKNNQIVVLTGVSYDDKTTGVVVYENGVMQYYRHNKFAKGSHGTGDIYASAFIGMYMQGKSLLEAATIAADFTYDSIANTQGDNEHWYGVKFEPMLKKLIEKL